MNIKKIFEDMKKRKELYQKKLKLFNITIDDLLIGNEYDMLNILQQKLKTVNVDTYSQKSTSRGKKRAKDLKTLTRGLIKQNFKYLDLGCNDGNLTNAISDYFNFDKNNVYGVDVKEWQGVINDCHVNNMFYINEELPKLPYPNNFFDMITCFLVLHHNKQVNLIIEELKRVLKKGGILILREHNIDNYITKEFVDFEHLIYICIESETIDVSKYIGNYKSKKEWRKLFGFSVFNSIKNFGFTNIYTDVLIK